MPNKRALMQATFDGVVERGTRRVLLVDPNRRPDGPLIHAVNSRGGYMVAFRAHLQELVRSAADESAQNIHFAGKRGWTRTNFGWTYEATFRYMVGTVAKDLGLTSSFRYALDGINVQNGALRGPDNRRTFVLNYTDTEVSQSEDQIGKDFRALGRILSDQGYRGIFDRLFINWPTGNWMPHPADVPGLLRKSDFYSDMDSIGRRVQHFTVLCNSSAAQMLSEVMDFVGTMPTGKGLVIKPNVAGLRALGVYLINPRGESQRPSAEDVKAAIDDILDPRHTGTMRIKEWLVEEEIDRDFISYEKAGTRYRIYYDLIPMIVDHTPVSTYAKYSVVRDGERMVRMPGQHPVVFAFLGIDGRRDLADEIAGWEREIEPYMPQLHERARSDGLKPGSILGGSGVEEGEESHALREYLIGSGLVEAAEAAAVDAKMALERRLDAQLDVLRESLSAMRRR